MYEPSNYQAPDEFYLLSDICYQVSYLQKYEQLLSENKLLFTADLIKEKLTNAYRQTSETAMANDIEDIIDLCSETGNTNLLWFKKLLETHFEGIIAHATYNISAGKIEGINNKIKTLRRQAYGYYDDEYFFLKIFDISRKTYVKNTQSHKILE